MNYFIRIGEDTLEWSMKPGRVIEIIDIYVRSERRKGRGREMVKLLKQEIPKDTALIVAITRKSNTIAHQFYEALGFRIVGRLHRYYREDKEDGLMYGLDL